MAHKKIKIIAWLLAFVTVLFVSPLAVKAEESDFSVNAGAAFAIDAETGKILYDQNGETPVGIASVTKILSTYLILESVNNGTISWEDQVPISEYTGALSLNWELSNVPLYTNQTYSVQELYQAGLIASANAAVAAMGEYIAGSEANFVDMMKAKLTEWGIDDAKIVNSSGLNNSYLGENIYPGSAADDENMMSAKDVAIVAQHLINDFPEVLETTAVTSMVFSAGTASETEMTNWNWMLPGFLYEKADVDGLKTGTTDFAGECFVGTMEQNGTRVITVILNAGGTDTDTGARFTQTGLLMDYCYNTWSRQEISLDDATVPDLETLAVPDGEEMTVPITVEGSVTLWVKNGADSSNVAYDVSLDDSLVTDNELAAPVSNGLTVGTATVTNPDDTLGYLNEADNVQTVELVTTQEVLKANFFIRIARSLTNWLNDLIG
ncbi:serine hydrolase [Enterococcus sp. LJL120]